MWKIWDSVYFYSSQLCLKYPTLLLNFFKFLTIFTILSVSKIQLFHCLIILISIINNNQNIPYSNLETVFNCSCFVSNLGTFEQIIIRNVTAGVNTILTTFKVPDIFNLKTFQVTLPFPDVSFLILPKNIFFQFVVVF